MDVVDRVRLCRKDVATAEGREVSRSRGSNSEFVRPWPTSQYQESIYFLGVLCSLFLLVSAPEIWKPALERGA